MVRWEHRSSTAPALAPDSPYDKEGVFTGCLVPNGPQGEENQMTVFYTSVNNLPIHWTMPYVRGCEGLSAAVSKDGGSTWEKVLANPILPEEPNGISVTGWRDPYLAEWDSLDEIVDRRLGLPHTRSLYGIIAGGIKSRGPAIFLYSIPADNLLKWRYMGILLTVPANLSFSQKWGADLGVNWECANFMTLDVPESERSRDFIISGSEGGKERPWIASYHESEDAKLVPKRAVNYSFWVSGSLVSTENGNVSFRTENSGILDHGCFYAPSSFQDPVSGRRILWGWIKEEDIPAAYWNQKGWTGSLSLPRELFVQKISNVIGALHSDLGEITTVTAVRNPTQPVTFDIETLGIRPLAELSSLRVGPPVLLKNISLSPSMDVGEASYFLPLPSSRFELEALIDLRDGCDTVGFHIRHNQDMSTVTTILFLPADEEIRVIRSHSNRSTDISKSEERGALTLFKVKDGNGTVLEPLKLHVFSDGNTLEVYANERFALATVVYTTDPEAIGLTAFVEGRLDSAAFREVRVWTDFKRIS